MNIDWSKPLVTLSGRVTAKFSHHEPDGTTEVIYQSESDDGAVISYTLRVNSKTGEYATIDSPLSAFNVNNA